MEKYLLKLKKTLNVNEVTLRSVKYREGCSKKKSREDEEEIMIIPIKDLIVKSDV